MSVPHTHLGRMTVCPLCAIPEPQLGVYIGLIKHDGSLCRRGSCECWCSICERHNAGPDYEARVEQMAVALHRDCELVADARYALDARPDPWQGDRHGPERHYGQAHDLVRRIFGEAET